MLSRVFTALYAKSPGNPATAYQNRGAATPSEKFSATDSTAPRATPASSRAAVSRPTMCPTASRPAARLFSRPRTTARAWSWRPRNAIRVLATTASSTQPKARPSTRKRSIDHAAATPAPATRITVAAPPSTQSQRGEGVYRRRSASPASLPSTTTGCGTRR